MKAKTRCRPHHWMMPTVGDPGLTCEVCGRALRFGEITPNMRASIAVAYEARCGEEAGDAFRAAFQDAFLHEVERLFPR